MKKTLLLLLVGIVLMDSGLAKEYDIKMSVGKMKVEDFTTMVSKVSKKQIIATDELTSRVNFYSSGMIDGKSFPSVVKKIMESNNLILVNKGDFYQLELTKNKRVVLPKIMSNIKEIEDEFVLSAIVIELTSVRAEAMAARIPMVLSEYGRVIALQESNKVMVIDYKSGLEASLKMVESLEKKGDFETKTQVLKKVNVSDVFKKIEDYSNFISTELVISKTQVLSSESGNAIIMTGGKKYLDLMDSFLSALDASDVGAKGEIKVFQLKNADAAEIKKTIESIIAPVMSADAKTALPIQPSGVQLTVDVEMNVIVAYAPEAILNKIETLIVSLDVPRKQVYVKTTIIEVEEDNLRELGIKYGVEGVKANDMGIMSIASSLTGAPIANSILSRFAGISNLQGANQLLMLGINIDLMQREGVAEIMSEPSILCVNNKESSIYVGQTESILSAEASPSVGGIVRNFVRQDIGLSLNIKPRILDNKNVNLDVKTIMEGIIRRSETSEGMPTTTKREVHTHVIVKNGEPVIIGGLTKTEDSKSISKIPFLGDIPFIGSWLFSSNSESKKKTNLVVVLTPYIIESTSDMEKLREEMLKIKESQRGFNKEFFAELEKMKK